MNTSRNSKRGFKQHKLLIIGVGSLSLALLLVAILVFASGNAALAKFSYGTAHSLEGATSEQIGQFALQYTKAHYNVLSGSPQVVLTKAVKKDDLPALGLDSINFASIEQPPLMLVIVKGDLGGMQMLGGVIASVKDKWHFSYVAYVFDLKAAEPALQISSPHGGTFRKALNDFSLPDDNDTTIATAKPAFSQQQAVPQPALTSVPSNLHYGDVVPTVQPKS
jgi:hypothetical protein